MQCSKHLARRYDSATRAANTGATVAQLEAIFGWEGGAMASPYTRAAERRRLALESMRMLANNHRTSIAAPSKKGAAHFATLNAKGNFPDAPHHKPQDAVTDDG
jgi:hypothetical protein